MLTILYWHTIYPRLLKGLKQRFPAGGDEFYRRDWSLACVGVMLLGFDLGIEFAMILRLCLKVFA